MVILPEEIIRKIMLYIRHPVAQLVINKYSLMKAPLFTTLKYYQYICRLPYKIHIDYEKIYCKEKYRYTLLTDSDTDEEEE